MATKNKGQRPTERAQPGSSSTRLEKSRKLAQKRRETYKDLMTGIMESLPFSREVLSQLDYNSRLRLGLCFLKMKKLLEKPEGEGPKMIEAPPNATPTSSKAVAFQPGVLQELMIEAMDGFLMVLLSDGSIVYVSESIQKHLGLFQSEHMGTSLYDLVLEEDHASVKMALSSAEIKAHTRFGIRRVSVPCSFFCRMRCSRNKVANTQSKSPGYKVVHTSGYFQLRGSEAYLVALVKPVTPPSILEIRMEGNMFVTHYALDMRCTFFDGRLRNLMGYAKEDLKGKLAFDFHHHDDTEATLECSRGIQARGEGMSGYYRMINKQGEFVWLQTRATMMFDSHTGNPSYIVCMNFIISKEKGQRTLESRALPSPEDTKSDVFISEEKSKAHDPFPIPREDGKFVNPLSDDPTSTEDDVPSSLTGATMATTGKGNDDVIQIKTEIESSPEVSLPTEEPSSTTSPPPPPSSLPGSGGSPNINSASSWEDRRRYHGNSTPSSGVASAGESDAGDCVPDSTSAGGRSSPEVISNGSRRGVESGYSSRVESTSSYRRKQHSDSESSNPGSMMGMSGTQIHSSGQNEVFTEQSSENNTTTSTLSHNAAVVNSRSTNVGSRSSVRSESDVVYQNRVPGGLETGGVPVSQPYSSCQHQQELVQCSASNLQQPMAQGTTTTHQNLPQSSFGGSQQQQIQHPLTYQSGPTPQQPPLPYESGPRQTLQNGQPQRQIAFQSGPQQPISYQNNPPQTTPYQMQQTLYQSGQPQQIHSSQNQTVTYSQSSQPLQPLTYQTGQTPYQSGQQIYHSGPLQQPNAVYSNSPSLSSYHTNTQAVYNPQSQRQQMTDMKQEMTQPPPPCRYSMQQQAPVNGTGTQQQYQYQTPPGLQPQGNNGADFNAHQIPLTHNIQTQFQSHTPQIAQGHTPQIAQPQGHTPQIAPPQSHTHQIASALHNTNVYQSQGQGFQQPLGGSLPQNHPNIQAPPQGMMNPSSTGLDPGNLPLFSTLGHTSGTTSTFNPSVTQRAPGGFGIVESGVTPQLSHHHQGYQAPATVSTDGVTISGHVTSHVMSHMTPDLVNLTGEDLQILDFIDQYDAGNSNSGSGSQFVQQ